MDFFNMKNIKLMTRSNCYCGFCVISLANLSLATDWLNNK